MCFVSGTVAAAVSTKRIRCPYERVFMSDLPHTVAEPEPLEILLSNAQRISLGTELKRRVREAVEPGGIQRPARIH
jgi:hypothetical protein